MCMNSFRSGRASGRTMQPEQKSDHSQNRHSVPATRAIHTGVENNRSATTRRAEIENHGMQTQAMQNPLRLTQNESQATGSNAPVSKT